MQHIFQQSLRSVQDMDDPINRVLAFQLQTLPGRASPLPLTAVTALDASGLVCFCSSGSPRLLTVRVEDLFAQAPSLQDFVPPVALAQHRNADSHEAGDVSKSWARPSNAASAAPAPCSDMQNARHTNGIDIRWGAAAQCDVLVDLTAPGSSASAAILHAQSSADGSALVILDSNMVCHVFRVWHPRDGVPQLRQVRPVTPRAECIAQLPLPQAKSGSATARKNTAIVFCGEGSDESSLFAVMFPCASGAGAQLETAVHTVCVPPCPPSIHGAHAQHRPWLVEQEIHHTAKGEAGSMLGPAWPLSGARLSAAAAVPCASLVSGVLLAEGIAGGGCTGFSLWCPISRTMLAVAGQASIPSAAVAQLKVAPPCAAPGDVVVVHALAQGRGGGRSNTRLHHLQMTCTGTPVQRSDGSFAPSSWAWHIQGGGLDALQEKAGGPFEVVHGGVQFIFSRRFTLSGAPLLHGGEVMLHSQAPTDTTATPPRLGQGGSAVSDGQIEMPAQGNGAAQEMLFCVEPPSDARDPPLHTPLSPNTSVSSSDGGTPPDTSFSPTETGDGLESEPLPESSPAPQPSDHPLALKLGGAAQPPAVAPRDPPHSVEPVQEPCRRADLNTRGEAASGTSNASAVRGRLHSLRTAKQRLRRVRSRFGRRVSALQGAAEHKSQEHDNQPRIASVQRGLGQHPSGVHPSTAKMPAVVHTVGPLLNPGVGDTQPVQFSGQPAHPLAAPSLCSLAALDAEIQRVQAAEFDAAAAAAWVRSQRAASGRSLHRCAGSALQVPPREAALRDTEAVQEEVAHAMQVRRLRMGWLKQ